MLSDDNIEAVVSFLPDVKTMATFASTGRLGKDMVYASIPAAIQSAKPKMTKLQRNTLGNLSKNPGLGHLKAIVERKCLLCKKDFRGAFLGRGGIPAHMVCKKRLWAGVKFFKGEIPTTEIVSLVPVEVRGEVSDWLKTQDEQEKKRRREKVERDGERRKKQRVENAKRRDRIEEIVNTTYLEWMRTVPYKAKPFVSRLSAEDSVAAVAIVKANEDLSDDAHEVVLRARLFEAPVTTVLNDVYALIRGHPEMAHFMKNLSGRYRYLSGIRYRLQRELSP